jgi:hypothetical protein
VSIAHPLCRSSLRCKGFQILFWAQVNVVQHMLQREPKGAEKMDRNNRCGALNLLWWILMGFRL